MVVHIGGKKSLVTEAPRFPVCVNYFEMHTDGGCNFSHFELDVDGCVYALALESRFVTPVMRSESHRVLKDASHKCTPLPYLEIPMWLQNSAF